jgi:manganese transport protein
MSSVLELTLGIMTALGGFLDVGEIVFAVQAGAKFGYLLVWAVVLGTVGIILFGEMSGRIAAVRKQPVFEVIRKELGFGAGFTILIASMLVNLLTCAAEVGGVALVLQFLSGAGFRAMVMVAAALLLVLVFFLPFRWIERVFGVMGLALMVYLFAAISEGPDWGEMARGLLPHAPEPGQPDIAVYLYVATGVLSSIMMPYEVYFYSSGGIEEHWTPKDLPTNKLTAGIGFLLGGILTVALVALGAEVFLPKDIDPQHLGTSVLAAATSFGRWGLYLALVGIFFAVAGAAVETALAGGYNVAQFFSLPWGKSRKAIQVPTFTVTWMLVIALGACIAMSGLNPITVVEFSVLFAIIVLPFTYYPILRMAGNPQLMGKHVNSRIVNVLGWIYLAIISVVALGSVPLMLITRMGEG